MGNCTGYCTGCKDGPEGISASGGVLNAQQAQVKQSYNQNSAMMKEGFAGEAFSGFDGGEGDGYTSQ